MVIVVLTPGAKAPPDGVSRSQTGCMDTFPGHQQQISESNPRTGRGRRRKSKEMSHGLPRKSGAYAEQNRATDVSQHYFQRLYFARKFTTGLGPLHPEDDFPAKLGCSPRLTSSGQPSNHQPHPEAAVLPRSLVALREGGTRKRLAQ